MTNPMTVDMIKPRSSPPNIAPNIDPMFFLGDSEFSVTYNLYINGYLNVRQIGRSITLKRKNNKNLII